MRFFRGLNTDYSNHRYLSEDGKWELFVWPVMFGFRVRIAEVGKAYVLVDYCCTNNLELLSATLAVCLNKLEALNEINEKTLTEALPNSKDKLFRDDELLKFLGLDSFVRG